MRREPHGESVRAPEDLGLGLLEGISAQQSGRLVNHTHSAATELLDNAVVRDSLADERLKIRHLALILGCR